MIYKINQSLDVPIYQQLVDIIESAIKKGELPYGEKLPTVQEMIDLLGVARGTVKRAYDELEFKGIIQKSQGRGTFVSYKPSGVGSRKEQAVAAIDNLFAELEKMGFSAAEINIFVNLKLRELAEEESLIKVAVVDRSHEVLLYISDQLHGIPGVDVYTYTTENIEQYPYKLGGEFDVIVSTEANSQYLETVLPSSKKPTVIALRPSTSLLSEMVKLADGKRLGCIAYSESFGRMVRDTWDEYAKNVRFVDALTASASDTSPVDYLTGLDALIVPKHYRTLFSASIADTISGFQGDIIVAAYELDKGSMLYLERRIKRLYEAKNI